MRNFQNRIMFIAILILGIACSSAKNIVGVSNIGQPINYDIYKHYVDAFYEYDKGYKLTFHPDFTFSYGYENTNDGEWKVSNDTLFLYENYVYTPNEEDLNDEIILMDTNSKYYRQFYKPLYRQVVYIDDINDYPFAQNVTAFKIYGYGERLVSIGTSLTDQKEFFYAPSKFENNHPPKFVGNSYIPNGFYPWERVEISWKEGCFTVNEKINYCGKIFMVVLERDNILYHIINPIYYLNGSVYNKNDEGVLTNWMYDVKVGKTYSFKLSRPLYPFDTLSNVPQIKSGDKYLYIGGGEAYGYFFAQLIK